MSEAGYTDEPFIYYLHSYELMKYRGFTPATPELKKQEFFNKLKTEKYIKITGAISDANRAASLNAKYTDQLNIVFFDIGKYTITEGKINALFSSNMDIDTIYIIKGVPNFRKKYEKYILNTGKKPRGRAEYGYPEWLMANMTNNIYMTHCELVPSEELKTFIAEEHHEREDLSEMQMRDVALFWHGFKTGDVIKVKLPSGNTGTTIVYKKVI